MASGEMRCTHCKDTAEDHVHVWRGTGWVLFCDWTKTNTFTPAAVPESAIEPEPQRGRQELTDETEESCYLCEKEIIQRPGQEFKLRCERGGPITVCEGCYEDALDDQDEAEDPEVVSAEDFNWVHDDACPCSGDVVEHARSCRECECEPRKPATESIPIPSVAPGEAQREPEIPDPNGDCPRCGDPDHFAWSFTDCPAVPSEAQRERTVKDKFNDYLVALKASYPDLPLVVAVAKEVRDLCAVPSEVAPSQEQRLRDALRSIKVSLETNAFWEDGKVLTDINADALREIYDTACALLEAKSWQTTFE